MKLPASFSLLTCCALSIVASLPHAGCAWRQRSCVSTSALLSGTVVDLNDNEEPRPTERQLWHASLERLKNSPAAAAEAQDKKYQVLALSGGGSHGAFSAGVLNGWTASGERPELEIVTGVSTGALIATYAFLGPQYDDCLRELYTNTSSHEIYQRRRKVAILWSESAATSEPLQRLIEKHITPRVLSEVAQGHAAGRRLFVGTTNLDTGRLVIWNMGAIASSGRPDALQRYRQIILASASVPGFFPPVKIDITVNDERLTELHADGGATAQVFFRASMLDLEIEHFAQGQRPLVGSQIYILVAGKIYPDPKCVQPKLIDIASSSLTALTSAQTRNDLARIYTLTLLSGMDYNVAAIPQDLPISEDALNFDKAQMQELFEQGYRMAVENRVWSNTPPVLDAYQQSLPRSGTEFFVPERTSQAFDSATRVYIQR